MPTLTRRNFLIASGGAGAAAIAAGATGVTWQQLMRSAASNPLPAGEQVLVVLTLYGGNDGLNTLVPYADAAYHSARPDLAYTPEEVQKLDGEFGLNPAMAGFAKLWQQHQLAIVRGVGYPEPDHSHFRSMDIWQTAAPQSPVNTGWIGRWLDATGDDPLRAVNIGSVLPPLVLGAKASAAALPLGRQRTAPKPLSTALMAMSQPDPTDSPSRALVCSSFAADHQVDSTFATVLSPNSTGEQTDQQSPAGSGGGQGSLADQLAVVAKCITAGVPTRVYSVSQGGFDTHADEKDAQKNALDMVDKAVSAFLTAIGGTARGKDVTLMMYSEFGRRVQANASQGTDHGTAGPMFVAGPRVKGGYYGDQPSLTDLDNGDLKVTTDFRAVYAELLDKVLGADPTQIVGSPSSFINKQGEVSFL
ncbi:MAG TPA: DUF1501 domain-containing protein [Jatrophihabitans sp.]|nr:DUF1501 domain-containing protein [Jatrophihabitans sp.]